MKKFLILLLALVSLIPVGPALADDWKGKPDPSDFVVGAMMGLGVFDSTAGLTLVGVVSRRILEQGFAPDINNSVFAELELGPFVASEGTALFYSTHLRWDFTKDASWKLFALGGVGGFSTGSGLGSKFEFFPRFGIGSVWKLQEKFSLRTELSHELVGFGLAFSL